MMSYITPCGQLGAGRKLYSISLNSTADRIPSPTYGLSVTTSKVMVFLKRESGRHITRPDATAPSQIGRISASLRRGGRMQRPPRPKSDEWPAYVTRCQNRGQGRSMAPSQAVRLPAKAEGFATERQFPVEVALGHGDAEGHVLSVELDALQFGKLHIFG